MAAEASEASRRNLRREVRWIECGGSDDGPIAPDRRSAFHSTIVAFLGHESEKSTLSEVAEPHPVRLVLVPVNKAPQ